MTLFLPGRRRESPCDLPALGPGRSPVTHIYIWR